MAEVSHVSLLIMTALIDVMSHEGPNFVGKRVAQNLFKTYTIFIKRFG